MKITKADLVSLIHETLESTMIREQEDKYDKDIKVIDGKILSLNIQVAKLKLDKAKLKLDQSIEKRNQAEESADAGKRSGKDTAELDSTLKAAIEAEAKARDGVIAANNNLKSVQKGGSSN